MAQTVRVIVEMKAPRAMNASAQIGATLQAPNFQVDPGYRPVPTKSNDPQLQMSLDANQEQVVIIRGTVNQDDIDQLRQQSNVVDVYIDSEIAPFTFRSDLGVQDGCRIEVDSAAATSCPIPPCDCTPSVAHGTLSDVAVYLGADQIWASGIHGDGIVVGIVDGGITAEGRLDPPPPGLIPRVIGGWPTANWGTIARWGGHGNMTATDTLGMAPRAEIYDIRIADSPGISGTISDAIAGFQWAIEKFRLDGTPQILSNSWGIFQESWDAVYASNPNHPFTRKVVEALDEGILVLFAAGNCGQTCPDGRCGSDNGPGKSIWGANGHPRVMTVGAVNKDEQFIGYSSQGPAALDPHKPDFCAVSHFEGYFHSDSGTSAACPIAAGVVALLKQARPSMSQNAAKRLLTSTAKDIGPPGWDRHSGAGVIRAKAAFDELMGSHAIGTPGASRVRQLEVENRHLKEMFVELAIADRMRKEGAAAQVGSQRV